jgi:hypothetical protein
MAFKLRKNPTFTTTAKILQPTDDGSVEHTVRVQFKQLSEAGNQMDVRDALREAILNITDVVDDDDVPVPFGPDLLEQMLATPFITRGLIAAYWEAMSGARLGN